MKSSFMLAGSCITLLTLLLFSTDPNHIPSLMLITPFVLLGIALTIIIAFFLERKGLTRAHSLRMGGFLAALPIVLLVFQSIGQLTVRDVATILALFAISYFYVIRAHAKAE